MGLMHRFTKSQLTGIGKYSTKEKFFVLRQIGFDMTQHVTHRRDFDSEYFYQGEPPYKTPALKDTYARSSF